VKKIFSNKFYSIGILLIIAVFIRIFFLRFEYAVGWDEVNYLKLGASGAIHGLNHILHPYWSPLYPFFVALVGKFFSNYELASRLVSILFGTILIVPVYRFAEKYLSNNVAWFCSLLIAFFPMLIESSVSALTETLYIFMAITGIILGFLAIQKKSILLAAITGGLFSLAYLTRPEGFGCLIVFVGLTGGVLIYQIIKNHEYRLIFILLGTIVSFLIISSPYLYYLHQVTGWWTLSSKGRTNMQGSITAMENKGKKLNPWLLLNEDNTHLPDDDIYHTGEFLKYYQSGNQANDNLADQKAVRSTVFLILKKFVKNFYEVITTGVSQLLSLPLLLLAVLGLFGEPWDRARIWRELYLLSYVIFFWIVVIPMFHVTARYLLPMAPIVLIWSGLGIERLLEWIQQTFLDFNAFWNKRLLFALKTIVVLILIGSFIVPGLTRMTMKNPFSLEEWVEPIEQKKAGLWLKDHCTEPPIIMAWNHAISFYAQNYDIKQTVSIPLNDLDRVLAYARNRGAKYLTLNEKNKDNFPTINCLLDESQIPPDLKLIYKDDSVVGLKTLIYEIL
jgi:4-amino-4-deoxy-L-arabinose transferase-like glycosyltransferase